MLFYLIQTNFVVFTILIFLYIFLLTNQTIEKQTAGLFLMTGIIVNILMVADMLDYYYASLDVPVVSRYITSATGYTLRPCVMIFVLLNQNKDGKRMNPFLMIPFAVNAALAYSSVYTGWMFYFDSHNKFHRGPIGLLPFLLSGYYLLVLTFWAFQRFRIGNRKESAVILLVVLMVIVGVCMESIFHFKFIVNGVAAVSIVFYYLFLHTQTFKRDALTNVLNRHSFYVDKERLKSAPMMVVSLDMNDLKLINDRQGHSAGDKAIKTVAEEIIKRLDRSAFLYRVGGDEFMLFCPKMTEQEAVLLVTTAEKGINEKGYSIAWGMAAYEPSMDMDKVISLSDERMYERKKNMKKQARETVS